jgi:hypothetical protein
MAIKCLKKFTSQTQTVWRQNQPILHHKTFTLAEVIDEPQKHIRTQSRYSHESFTIAIVWKINRLIIKI